MYRDVQTWRQNKPLRFGRNLDADVQQFLAQGVRIMDDFNEENAAWFKRQPPSGAQPLQ
jgi:hypothetical protein